MLKKMVISGLLVSAVACGGEMGSEAESLENSESTLLFWWRAVLSEWTSGSTSLKDLIRSGSTLYWIKDNVIYSVDTGGGPTQTVCADCGSPGGLAGDGTYLWYPDFSGDDGGPHEIRRLTIATGAKIDIATVVTNEIFGAANWQVDENHLYWTSGGCAHRVSRNGGTPIDLACGGIVSLALDGPYVYWGGDHGIKRRLKSGGSITTIVSIANGKANELEVSSSTVYWKTGNDTIKRWVSGTLTTYATSVGANYIDSFATDGTYIFYIERPAWSATRKVRRVATAGGAPSTIHYGADIDNAKKLLSDGTYLYWGDWQGVKIGREYDPNQSAQ